MSYTEIHTGKLKKLVVEDVKSWMIEKLFNNGVNVDTNKSISELKDLFFDNGLTDKYFIHGKNHSYTVFEFLNHYADEFSEDISRVVRRADGTYDFILIYYNGGICFSEVMEYALDDLKE